MSILSVANVHFESTGTNRLDYIDSNNDIRLFGLGNISINSVTNNRNIDVNGTGVRIRGDFTNSTVPNRVLFQTNILNGVTSIGTIPNGAGAQSGINLYNNSDSGNAGLAQIVSTATTINFTAGITGTGTYLPITFRTGGNESVRIDTTGNVGIGTTNTSTYLLNVNGTINAANVLVNGAPLTATGGGSLSISNQTTSVSTHYITLTTNTSGNISSANVSTTKLYFVPNTGTLSATVFNALSDESKKKDIKTIDSPLEITEQLRGVWFRWVDNNTESMGLIAQEVEKTLPQIVSQNEEGIKTLNYDALIGLLIEDIKKLNERIKILENK